MNTYSNFLSKYVLSTYAGNYNIYPKPKATQNTNTHLKQGVAQKITALVN